MLGCYDTNRQPSMSNIKCADKIKLENLLSQKTPAMSRVTFLPARCYASAGYSDRNVSVRPSVTRWYCVKKKKASVMISSPSGSAMILVF